MKGSGEVRSRRVRGRKSPEWKQLEGKFFHSFEDPNVPQEDRVVKSQGYVMSQPVEGTFLVQLFDLWFGEPSSLKLIHFDEMRTWEFYLSSEEMRDAYDRKYSGAWQRKYMSWLSHRGEESTEEAGL